MTELFGQARSGAEFSPCGEYRYALWRNWGDARGKVCLFLMLNPSTADAMVVDPTVARCLRFARSWGFARLWVANLFALKSTDPSALYSTSDDSVGPDNDAWILEAAKHADLIVVGYGKHGRLRERDKAVAELLRDRKLHCLALNQDGTPKHPLYIAGSTELLNFQYKGGAGPEKRRA